MKRTIAVPGVVARRFFEEKDRLDLGLPEPEVRRHGTGQQFVYRDLPDQIVRELAAYMLERSRDELATARDRRERAALRAGRDMGLSMKWAANLGKAA